jgi:hypothetical protein
VWINGKGLSFNIVAYSPWTGTHLQMTISFCLKIAPSGRRIEIRFLVGIMKFGQIEGCSLKAGGRTDFEGGLGILSKLNYLVFKGNLNDFCVLLKA